MTDTALAIAPQGSEFANLRPLGVIRDYAQLHAALRHMAETRDISRQTIDEISGNTSGYSSKVLAPIPIRAFGKTSLGPTLGTLGVALLLVEDPLQLARVAARYLKRDLQSVHSNARDLHAEINYRISVMRSMSARHAAQVRWTNATPEMRTRSARKAARTRRANKRNGSK